MKLDDKYKWLARDEDGELYAYEDKPFKVKKDKVWDNEKSFFTVNETDSTFSFIEWEDSEPMSIKEVEDYLEAKQDFKQTPTQSNPINKPSHYIGINGLEVEEVLENFLPKVNDGYVAHRLGSAVEYLLRSSSKNGLEDIKKAKRNLEQVIEYEEGNTNTINDQTIDGLKEKGYEVNKLSEDFIIVQGGNQDELRGFLNTLSKIPNEITNYHAGTNPLD